MICACAKLGDIYHLHEEWLTCGDRDAPLCVLEKLADLYGCDLYSLYEENEDVRQMMLATAFRVDNLAAEDMEQLAVFKRVVKNYMKMDMLLKR